MEVYVRSKWVTSRLHLSFLGLGLACAPEIPPAPGWSDPERWQAWHTCEDSVCREALVREAFAQDPPLAARWMDLIASPEERLALVQTLVTDHPAKTSVLCPVIEDPGARESCERNTSRPHLYAPPPRNQNSPAMRTAEGPDRTTMILPPSPSTRLSLAGPDLGSCAAGTGSRACLMTAAQEAARQGDGGQAARHCLAIEGNETWRGDCHFQAAEVLAQVKPVEAYPEIADLCRASGQWAGRCVDKVNTRMAQLAPSSSAAAEGWSSTLEAAEAIRQAWAAEGPVIRERVLAGFWSSSLARSYAQSSDLSGNPLDHLPPEAEPHIRAACAWALIQRSQPAGTNLEHWRQQLEAVLSARTVPTPGTVSSPGKSPSIKDLWEMDGPEDGGIPAIIYMGTARRALGSNPAEDMQICLLEAAVRSGQAWHALIRESETNSSRLVAWTATRLLERKDTLP